MGWPRGNTWPLGVDPPPDNTMKNIILILLLGTSLLGGCAVYLPDDGPVARPQGCPGNGFCPPGAGEKGQLLSG